MRVVAHVNAKSVHLILLSIALLWPPARVHAQQFDVEAQLQEFATNPQAFVDRNPVKRVARIREAQAQPTDPSAKSRLSAAGTAEIPGINAPASSASPFSAPQFLSKDLTSGRFAEKKFSARLGKYDAKTAAPRFCNPFGVCLRAISDGLTREAASVGDLLDSNEFRSKKISFIDKIQDMDHLTSGEVKVAPWSGFSWPISQGLLGARYVAKDHDKLGDNWAARFELVRGPLMTLTALLEKNRSSDIEQLSPAEKYDLLISDPKVSKNSLGQFTTLMWQEGEAFRGADGNVEGWIGIHHGWAGAATMLPRPHKAVTVKAADGKTDVKFYPTDIKALASYLWARAQVPNRFLGGRCNNQTAKRDAVTGRALNSACLDTAPRNWHLAIVNQIGQARRSLIFDATNDHEIQGQPILSYSYRYFNPQTGKLGHSLIDSIVALVEFNNDKFPRKSNPAFVVGVAMDVTYLASTLPLQQETDDRSRDLLQTVTYLYDLELGGDGSLLGGEWYTNKHPDFLWSPAYGARALTSADQSLTQKVQWKEGEPIPESWKKAAQTALDQRLPLAAIVEALIEKSNAP